jgi:hypothetical protein
MAPTGSLELYQSLMKWLRTFPTTKDEADVTDGVDMAKVNTKIETKVNTKIDTKVNTKIETKVNTKIETKVNTKIDTKVNTKIETKVNTKIETKVNTKIENSRKKEDKREKDCSMGVTGGEKAVNVEKQVREG